MLKQKLLIVIVALGFVNYSQSVFEVQSLNADNIDYVQKNGYSIASINDKKVCVLVCYSQELQDFCGYLVAYYIDNCVQIELVSYSDQGLQEKIVDALLVDLEKRCLSSKIDKIYTHFSADDNELSIIYANLGYQKYSALNRAALSILRGMGSIIMFDTPSKGTFKKKVELYKEL